MPYQLRNTIHFDDKIYSAFEDVSIYDNKFETFYKS